MPVMKMTLMNIRDAFAILEIEITDDKRAIKKSYAKQVKQYHPEEYPEKWKEIHDAYETALRMAEVVPEQTLAEKILEQGAAERSREQTLAEKILEQASREQNAERILEQKTIEKHPEQVLERETIEKHPEQILEQETIEKEPKTESSEQLFEQLDVLAEEQKKKDEELRKKEIDKAIAEFKQIARQRKSTLAEWQAFFLNEENMKSICSSEFLYEMGGILVELKINEGLYRFLKEQLGVIAHYQASMHIELKQRGALKPIDYVNYKLSAGRAKRPKHEMTIRDWVSAGVSIIVVVLMIMTNMTERKENRQTTENATMLQYEDLLNYQTAYKYDSETNRLERTGYGLVSREAELKEMASSSDLFLERLKGGGVMLDENIYLSDLATLFIDIENSIHDINFSLQETEVPKEIEKIMGEDMSEYHTYAFLITSDNEQTDKVLWCNLEGLGFSDNCRIYYFDGGEYTEVVSWSDISGISAYRFRHNALEYNIFAIDIPQHEAYDLHPVVILENP